MAVGPLFALTSLSQAQQPTPSASQVPLSFQYRGVVNVYVNTYYQDGTFYLPVSELFNVLGIQHQVDQGAFTISGVYLGETEYVFDFKNQVARAGDTEIQLQAEDFLIPDIDYFVKPFVFEKLFGLNFTTSFNNLTLDLETEDKMPVIAEYEREQKRKQLDRQKPIYERTYYPLRYDRDYGTIDGAFVDYNLSAIYSNSSTLFTFSNALGMEFIGGDVQGNLFGAFSGEQQSFTTSGLRWRYVQRDNDYFSSAIVGQTNSEGLGNRSIRGVKLSNKPVEPRRLFDRYVIDGSTTPQSEVELYLNNSLVDYQEADESGNYRFVVPLTYGSTDYSLRIYTPSGRSIERNSRIQVPFDYLPKGAVDYTVSGGELTTPILGTTEGGYIGAATVSAGLSNWLTAQASTEYLTKYHGSLPSFTGTLNARLFNNYLISANVNSENFYRLTSSVVYSSGASWNLSYDYNPGESRLYNIGNSVHLARLNLFTPFSIGNVPLNIRWSSIYQQNPASSLLRYRVDLNTRMGRLNVRFGYRDQQAGQLSNLSLTTTSASRLTNSYTYSISRRSSVPKIFQGMFLRGQVSYLPGLNEFEETEVQLSRDIQRTGRFQLTFGHNFLGDFNSLGLNVTIDFNKLRSNTSATSNNSQVSVTQNIRGSIGYDPYGDQLVFNNRQQVGQSGAAVRMFVDSNNDGHYQPDSEQVIKDSAVRLNRSGGRTTTKNGINYISQLLPYYRYDIEINKSALSNPLLVPEMENFSIITDPNQFKPIEIPFYQSGVISGRVDRLQVQGQDSTTSGLSGVRLYLKSNYEDSLSRKQYSKEMRTFSDGSFYTYEIPPGKYDLYIDPNQLEFLDGTCRPDTMHIEVEALPQGDFIEGLQFLIVPEQDTVSSQESPSITSNEPSQIDTTKYKVQIASFEKYETAIQSVKEAQKKFGQPFTIKYNRLTNLYAIRSMPISRLQTAVNLLLKVRKNSLFIYPALVVMNDEMTKFPVQLGAFATKKRAEKFISGFYDKFEEIQLTYHHDPEDKLYKVWTEPVGDHSEAQKLLEKYKNTGQYSDAFIPSADKLIFEKADYNYEVRIENIPQSKQLTIPAQLSSSQVAKGPKDNTISITGIPSWWQTVKIEKTFSKLNPGTEPFIILTEKNKEQKADSSSQTLSNAGNE